MVFIIFLVGLFVLLRAGWSALASYQFIFHPVAIAYALWGWFIWFLHDQAAVWITAIATAALWRATAMLTRATNIEHALNGPFLNIHFTLQPENDGSGDNERVPYFQPWADEDATKPFLKQRSNGLPPRYVIIHVENTQTSPHGVATNIKIKAQLDFGAPDDVAPHPYTLERPIPSEVILAGRYVEGPVFNVAGLVNWQAILSKVEYQDVLGRPRTAAVGAGLRRIVSGNLTQLVRVFEPRKGEYSDAD